MMFQKYKHLAIKGICVASVIFAVSCGDSTRTGTDAGEENRENPNQERQHETNKEPPTEHKNNEAGETNAGRTADSLNLDSASIKQ